MPELENRPDKLLKHPSGGGASLCGLSADVNFGFPKSGPARAEAARFKCVVSYDGTDYCGWQSQAGGGSVQDFIERRLQEIFARPVRIFGSGRTDSGVHSDAQVFHFDAEWRHSTEALLAAMRSGYPDSIRIRSLSRVSKNFHARFGVKAKRYVYRIYEGYAPPNLTRYRWSTGNIRLDVQAMREASEIFLGLHDFTAFSANRGDGSKVDPMKRIDILKISRKGRELKISVEGSGFLYRMVRLIVGALYSVGRGKLKKEELKAALDSKKRSNLFQAAPAKGLSLNRVFYSLPKRKKLT